MLFVRFDDRNIETMTFKFDSFNDLFGFYALCLVSSQVVFIYLIYLIYLHLLTYLFTLSTFVRISVPRLFSLLIWMQFVISTVCSSSPFQEELDLRCSGADIDNSITRRHKSSRWLFLLLTEAWAYFFSIFFSILKII